jgi:hypothetical protein
MDNRTSIGIRTLQLPINTQFSNVKLHVEWPWIASCMVAVFKCLCKDRINCASMGGRS